MREGGAHGVDGYDVWKGDERADDSFFQDRESAQEAADRLNEGER